MEFKCIFNSDDKVVIEKLSIGGWLIKNVWVWQNSSDPNRVLENIVSDSFAGELAKFVDNYVLGIPTADLFVYGANTLRISTEQNEFGEIKVRFRTEGKDEFVSNYFDVKKCLEIKNFLEGEN